MDDIIADLRALHDLVRPDFSMQEGQAVGALLNVEAIDPDRILRRDARHFFAGELNQSAHIEYVASQGLSPAGQSREAPHTYARGVVPLFAQSCIVVVGQIE